MKNRQKVFVVLCLLLGLAATAYGLWATRQTMTRAAAQAGSLEYAFSSNGIMFGSEPSPLEIVQATRNSASLPINGSFKAEANLLDDVVLQVKNTSSIPIKSAKLIIDFVDAGSNRIVAQICSGNLKGLTVGGEQSTKLSFNPETLRKTIAQLGGAVRILVRVDLVELENATSWKYGLIHQQDPNNPNHWVPVSAINRIGQTQNHFKPQPASFRPAGKAFSCGYFWGYISTPHYCPTCQCDLYDEDWRDEQGGSNHPGPMEFGNIPIGCGGYTPAQCSPCAKIGLISPFC